MDDTVLNIIKTRVEHKCQFAINFVQNNNEYKQSQILKFHRSQLIFIIQPTEVDIKKIFFQSLEKFGINIKTNNHDFSLFDSNNGKPTAAEIYEYLFDNNGKICVFDNVPSLFAGQKRAKIWKYLAHSRAQYMATTHAPVTDMQYSAITAGRSKKYYDPSKYDCRQRYYLEARDGKLPSTIEFTGILFVIIDKDKLSSNFSELLWRELSSRSEIISL